MTNSSFIKELPPFIQQAWEKEGFQKATDIQEKTFPLIINDSDVIAQSPTGTGKTLAYLLPLLSKIDSDVANAQVVILASSRELVMQIYDEVLKWTMNSGIRSASFIGGANTKRQLEKLKKKPQIIVGTPGKIEELLNQKKLKMHEVKTIVLDEGDTLIVPEHYDTVMSIIKSTMKDTRQLLLFSATVTNEITEQMKQIMKTPEILTVQKDENFSGKVDHFYFVCEKRDKVFILEKIARLHDMKALVFMKDIGDIDFIATKLKYKQMDIAVLHAESTKSEREKAIKGFRKGIYPMMLSTDVSARGLDIKGLTTVVHFDLPRTLEQYTHRSGRTGRAGNNGTVISIITASEEKELKQLAKKLNITVEKKEFYHGRIVDERQDSHTKKPKNKPAKKPMKTFKKTPKK
ncbi:MULTISPECIES: DEAD/DEAH box helicase [Bacillus]|uniref:DEAD/DEAH box helicase n=1 Tax=Bacillus TaxID=1386 RepID=UPI0002D6917E|nr:MULTISPECIES: DEAD/DEAH box helicase [Bacillus]